MEAVLQERTEQIEPVEPADDPMQMTRCPLSSCVSFLVEGKEMNFLRV
ncbi:MAG: hypothetical protein L0Y72_18625 [Gemmataceae bacterium]|nr:hypothetical protein [Gemmataceae bacterium]MCI0741063.1 hypothetical protein [Gemmataceae bacterium]